jgi:capsule polysaccharide export protein KpsE/RkpR
LKSEIESLKKEKSVKKQQIGENSYTQDINENTKVNDKNTKFERKS